MSSAATAPPDAASSPPPPPPPPELHEETDVLQFRDPHQPDLHLIFWSRPGYTETPSPNILLWVHGLGEHSGRYRALVGELLARVPSLHGVASYDQRGHGRSAGARGAAPSVAALVDDLVLRASPRMALHFGPDARIVLGGHSLGALVAAGAAAGKDWLQQDDCGKIVGVFLSGPAIEPCVEGTVNRMLAPVGGLFAAIPGVKGMTKASGVDPKKLSHCEHAVKAYLDDELVHDKIGIGLGTDTLRYGRDLTSRLRELGAGEALLKGGATTLVVHGELDGVCQVEGSQRLVEASGADCAQLVVIPGAFHEMHNESKEHGRDELVDTTVAFLTKVFDAAKE